MLTKTKIALATALFLGTAPVALAGSDNDDGGQGGGFRVQTWQEIARDWQAFQNQIQRQDHTGNAANAYGYVAPKQTHRAHAQSQHR
jgi:hypothetical protein